MNNAHEKQQQHIVETNLKNRSGKTSDYPKNEASEQEENPKI